MKSLSMTGLGLVLLVAAACAQEAPDWAKRDYDVPASQVYVAALKSIQVQKHEVQSKDAQAFTVDFHVGITAWSWGYNMRLVVTPVNEKRSTATIGILRSGGKAFSWGSGRKEVRKIFAGIDTEISSSKASAQPPPSAQSEPSNSAVVEISSEPPGADIELEGKFVGNTPNTLRLKPGEYTITVKKAGYLAWSRKLTALADNELKVRAELEKAP